MESAAISTLASKIISSLKAKNLGEYLISVEQHIPLKREYDDNIAAILAIRHPAHTRFSAEITIDLDGEQGLGVWDHKLSRIVLAWGFEHCLCQRTCWKHWSARYWPDTVISWNQAPSHF